MPSAVPLGAFERRAIGDPHRHDLHDGVVRKPQLQRDLREQLMAEELDRAFKRYVSELRNSAHVEVRL